MTPKEIFLAHARLHDIRRGTIQCRAVIGSAVVSEWHDYLQDTTLAGLEKTLNGVFERKTKLVAVGFQENPNAPANLFERDNDGNTRYQYRFKP